MFSFLNKKNTNKNDEEDIFSKISSLLIHIAKIDQNYTIKEKDIIMDILDKL